MNNFDDKIKQALRAESDGVWKGAEEQGLFEQALAVIKGQQKFIAVMVYVVMVIFFAFMVYSIFQFFDADTTRSQIAWAMGFAFANLAVAMMKLWFWMQMDKNAVIREVKRLELQVATLAGIIKSQS